MLEILHSADIGDLIMRVYGFGPRQASQMIGKSSPRMVVAAVGSPGTTDSFETLIVHTLTENDFFTR